MLIYRSSFFFQFAAYFELEMIIVAGIYVRAIFLDQIKLN